jgi:oxygen-independent coproporphyrinogen-3 oxidase
MKSKSIGLYVHIPFCKRKCNYCDFCSFSELSEDKRRKYIDALIYEILSYSDKKLSLDTVFFGGGTPSILRIEELSKIVEAIKKSFQFTEDTEFTLEANPGTLTEKKLMAYRKFGVNRISLGLQSVHENEQKILGRIHNYDEFEKSFFLCRKAGFDNINVDLMYAIPSQSVESFSESINRVLSLSPEHISAYSLILEENTPLYENQAQLKFPSEDEEILMYELLCKSLADSGYLHYEISNYAKCGYQSRHNMKYWHSDDYIGVGVSAHSYFLGKRFYNTESIDSYINGAGIISERDENQNEAAYEYVMLALRTSEGFSLIDYKSRFFEDFLSGREEKLKKYEKLGYLVLSFDRIFLTEKGFYLSNLILSDLL